MDVNPCPLCGALPCDWVDDPHKAEVGLCWTLAKIREVLGVNEKPMMDELPQIIAARIAAEQSQAATIAALEARAGEVAEYLANQSDEPWPQGTESDRLHYWRDKALIAARTLKGSTDV